VTPVDGASRDELEQWLATLEEGADAVAFPSDAARDAYLDSLPTRSEVEVRAFLRRILMPTGEQGIDQFHREWLKHLTMEEPETFVEVINREYFSRLIRPEPCEPPWQGLSWILDLLPDWPMQAIEVLEAYFLAHMMHMPDRRISGIGDAQAVIRAMWIGNPASGVAKRELVFGLGSERFEHLVGSLYNAMGYTTRVTARSRDGGRDLEISRREPGASEKSRVECKLWKQPVGVVPVRNLLGVVAHELATKGILVTASSFTSPARRLAENDPRLELLGWDELLPLLDQHLGADWGRLVDHHIAESMKRPASGPLSVRGEDEG
jgi:restriction system protein